MIGYSYEFVKELWNAKLDVFNFAENTSHEHVARFLPDSLNGLTRILSSLSRTEAIFVGEAAALLARIRMKELTPAQLPNSVDISFASGWMNDPLNEAEIQISTQRWMRLNN